MFKYTSKYCMMGMMSKNGSPFNNWLGFKKNKNNAVSFDMDFHPDFPKVNYSYIYERPKVKGVRKSTQIVSKFDGQFFKLEGKGFKEIRETKNKFNKVVRAGEYDKNKVLELIDKWDSISGAKYGWQRHSGYDRSFFNNWYALEQDNLISSFYYIGDKLVGYSVLHKNDNCYDYIIRKTNNTIRNTCLYVDYKTFESIYEKEKKPFLVNWGASGGGVLKYKKKFPVFQETRVYFYRIVRDES